MIGDDGIYRKKKLLTKLLCLCNHLLAVVKLRLIAERRTDLVALCLCEGECHTTTDDEGIALLKEVRDNIQLICNLRTAEDRYERTYRILNRLAEELDLLLHQVADHMRAIDVLGNTNIGAVCSMCSTKCIIYEYICERSQIL